MEVMSLEKRRLLFGSLSVLDNRLQSCVGKGISEMTMKQHFLMESICLFKEDYPTLKEASEFVGCSYQNVKRMAKELERRGYLHILEDTEDKRKLRLIPTDQYKAFSVKKNQIREEFRETLYQDISEEDIEITLRTIRTMIANIQEM